MSSNFADLGVPAEIAGPLAERGITDAFPIQALALPPALAGRDVCGKAPTGSGKTLAFGIPLALRVESARPRRPKGLVLAPTRELAAQIDDELRPLLAVRGRRSATFFGGVGFGPQLAALRKGVDVAVACPGRLADLVNQGEIHLDEVSLVVIDEADRMADMGFLPEVRRLLDQVRDDRQTLLFSATLDGDVDVLVRRYQHQPERCEIAADERDGHRTTHAFERLTRPQRVARTAALVAEHGTTVVFCRTKHGADRVARQLGNAGVNAVAIHGGRSQNQRTRALDAFARGKAQALVATDVAARGIHVDDVACVVHFDVAGDHKDYTHRSGRTGRAGADGVVVTLVTDEEVAKAAALRRDLDVVVLDGAGHRTLPGGTDAARGPSGRTAQGARGRRSSGGGGEGAPRRAGDGGGQRSTPATPTGRRGASGAGRRRSDSRDRRSDHEGGEEATGRRRGGQRAPGSATTAGGRGSAGARARDGADDHDIDARDRRTRGEQRTRADGRGRRRKASGDGIGRSDDDRSRGRAGASGGPRTGTSRRGGDGGRRDDQPAGEGPGGPSSARGPSRGQGRARSGGSGAHRHGGGASSTTGGRGSAQTGGQGGGDRRSSSSRRSAGGSGSSKGSRGRGAGAGTGRRR